MWFVLHRERHRLSRFQDCFKHFMNPVYPEFEAATVPLRTKRKASPTSRKLRINGDPVTAYRQSRKAKDSDHPDAP